MDSKQLNRERIILKGSVTKETLLQIEDILTRNLEEFHITFEDIDTVSKEVIEWLLFILNNKKKPIKIFVTQIGLHSYLSSFKIPCEIVDSFYQKLPKSLEIEAIAIGGSAGSNELIERILHYCNTIKIPIFIVQHLSSIHNDIHTKLFQQSTKYDLHYALDGELIKEKTAYIAPPNQHMIIENTHIKTISTPKVNFARPSISVLFESLSNHYKSKVLTILTCGYGKDGSDVLKNLSANNTPIIIQDKSECEAEPLVQNAINTGYFNHILKLEEIISLLDVLVKQEDDPEIERKNFLEAVLMIYGYDFLQYNQKMISRRIKYLLDQNKIKGEKELYRLVVLYPHIFKEFFFAVAISVTEFFRKPSQFVALKNIFQNNKREENLKIWVAGCATGEEAYSVAILLQSLNLLEKSIIYATDFNSVNIEKASNGLYEIEEIDKVKESANMILEGGNFKDSFLINGYCGSIIPSIRKKILFFQHNLVSDSDFNEFSLILCKNVLIYFDKPLQEKVIKLFYNSLPIGGLLQLGPAERIPDSCKNLFEIVDIRNRIYKKQ